MKGVPSCFLLAWLAGFALTVPVHAQVPTTGFLSIDCGEAEDSSYTDVETGLLYTSDAAFVDSGVSRSVAPDLRTNSVPRQFHRVRSFPEGVRNCYTLRPARGKANKYLIRARFMYGNYDALNQVPQFDLHIGVDFWSTVRLSDSSGRIKYEIVHVPPTNNISVCLINRGLGTPFISALELRPLDNSLYNATSGSLNLYLRYDLGSTTGDFIRYKDDVFDRIWSAYDDLDDISNHTTVNTSSAINPNLFDPPSIVMSTGLVPQNANNSLTFNLKPSEARREFYIYMYFAEVEALLPSQFREFNIYLNGELWYDKRIVPTNISSTVYSTDSETHPAFEFSLNKTTNSTLPPIINAIEIYSVIKLSQPQTLDQDAAAITSVKLVYGVTRNWQGDPCSPKDYAWNGLNCSYDGFEPARITSLNLSSSGLTGEIDPSISNLILLQSLDLSSNKLTGQLPDFLSRLPFLKVLNLKGNNFSGSVPGELLAMFKNRSLSLSIEGIEDEKDNSCEFGECQKGKGNGNRKVVISVVVSVIASTVLLIAIGALLWMSKRRKQRGVKKADNETNERDMSLKVKKREFTYSDILSITNNFERVVGKGGFGTVYHGYVGDSQVAVKMLSPSSIQGYKEFQAEAKLLMSVHHKNLTALVGYCNEGTNMGIIYEYMVNGDLERHLSDKTLHVLSWEERLRIATDAAQGLEYLHHGCKPPIVHRDVKPTNILLDEKFQGKLADFGLSRVFPAEAGTHVSTVVAGTPGYLDPEYYTSNWLTEKSDVYSFGIVILEIITSRAAIPKGNDKTHVIQWVSSLIATGDVKNMVDSRLRGEFDVNSVWRAVELAMACVSRTPNRRPTMSHVVAVLKECLAMQIARHDTESREAAGLFSVHLESGLGPGAR